MVSYGVYVSNVTSTLATRQPKDSRIYLARIPVCNRCLCRVVTRTRTTCTCATRTSREYAKSNTFYTRDCAAELSNLPMLVEFLRHLETGLYCWADSEVFVFQKTFPSSTCVDLRITFFLAWKWAIMRAIGKSYPLSSLSVDKYFKYFADQEIKLRILYNKKENINFFFIYDVQI